MNYKKVIIGFVLVVIASGYAAGQFWMDANRAYAIGDADGMTINLALAVLASCPTVIALGVVALRIIATKGK